MTIEKIELSFVDHVDNLPGHPGSEWLRSQGKKYFQSALQEWLASLPAGHPALAVPEPSR